MAQQQEQPQAAQRLTLVGVAERLLAGAAVAGAAIYVLINALYIEFYDDFGVRPEDVGLDRVAVLGRAAWIALVAIAVVGLIGCIYAIVTATSRLRAHRMKPESDREHVPERLPEKEKQEAEEHTVQERSETPETEMRRQEGELRTLLIKSWLLGIALLIATILILSVFVLFEHQVEAEVERVREGENVNGISLLVPFIDVRSTRAKVTWLGDKEKQPVELKSLHLMYLGRGREVAVFLACGHTTVVVPADDVAIDLFGRESDTTEERESERLEFDNLCGDKD
jgi:hypothetical protein